MKRFEELSAEEVLALSVWLERLNARTLRVFVEVFASYDESVADKLGEIAGVVEAYESILLSRFKAQYGPTLPEMREDWKVLLLGLEVSESVPIDITPFDLEEAEDMIFDSLKPEQVYRLALREQRRAREFYHLAIDQQTDPKLVSLYRELANLKDANIEWLKFRLKDDSPD